MQAMRVLLTSLALLGCDSGLPSNAHDVVASDASDAARRVDVPVARIASDEARERGRAIFRKNCAFCHGERADGQGVRQKALSSKPRDFGRPDWRDSVEPIDVYRVVSDGKRGTSMPAWPTLGDDEKWDVVAYVLRVAEDGP